VTNRDFECAHVRFDAESYGSDTCSDQPLLDQTPTASETAEEPCISAMATADPHCAGSSRIAAGQPKPPSSLEDRHRCDRSSGRKLLTTNGRVTSMLEMG